MGVVRIGVSGWLYPGWRGAFYPKGLPQKRELAYVGAEFPTVEVNGTFYSLKRPADFARWYGETPKGFVFAVKGSRYITHMRKLVDVEAPLANYFGQGVLALEDKLGPVLWQFPATTRFDHARFARFFDLLPRSRKAAAKLARRHDYRLKGRALTHVETDAELVHCIEVRNRSFACEAFYGLLRDQGLGLVVSDSPNHWPLLHEVTRDVVYMRLHGDTELYASGYLKSSLADWARRIRAASKQADVYVYFDNDEKVLAPRDAETLAGLLKSRSGASRGRRSRGTSSPGRGAGTAR
jgi:uncharacterized protein YecE (DUF72 family)